MNTTLTTFLVQISHKALARLDEIMTAKNLSNFGRILDAAINYPEGTFQQIEDPVYDGQGCSVRLGYNDRMERDLEVIAQRAHFRSVPDFASHLLCEE